MNRLLVFVLGVAVGLTIALLWRVDRVSPEPDAPAPVHAAAPYAEPVMPRPVVDTAVTAPIELEADEPGPVTDGDGTASLQEALAKAGGDYELAIVEEATLFGNRVHAALSDEHFFDFAMALSTTTAPVATQHYQALNEELQSLPSVNAGMAYVQNLACGRRICTASLVGIDQEAADQAWREYMGDGDSETSGLPSTDRPVFTFNDGLTTVTRSLQTAIGHEYRMVFVRDPEIRSFRGGGRVVVGPRPRRDGG